MCVGLYNAMQYEIDEHGNIVSKSVLWWWGVFIDRLDGWWIHKPLGGCLRCMASVYSIIPYWWYCGWEFGCVDNWLMYPFYILMVSGANTVLDNMIEG